MTTSPSTRRSDPTRAARVSRELAAHLLHWQLPPDWRWGSDAEWGKHRHYQEVVDALGRSLSLVTAPDPAHAQWLHSEAQRLAHRDHPSISTTYHYWADYSASHRGPGYLRRWIIGETVGARLARQGPDPTPYALQVLRAAGSAMAYLHDLGLTHGAMAPETILVTPTGRVWVVGWQWVLPRSEIPAGLAPGREGRPQPPEWVGGEWSPTFASDQWQLAAAGYAALTGEMPPSKDIPPIRLLQPETPVSIAAVIDKALARDPSARHASVASFIRAIDRAIGSRTMIVTGVDRGEADMPGDSQEARLRWALGDDYEVLASLGAGNFGSVWRVRDLTLGREVALKMLHPHIARDERAVSRFRREARLAVQLAHPAIIPIFDWDSRGDVAWYTMELGEAGSLAELIDRGGARALDEIASQIDLVLDALTAAHASGIIHRDLKPENVLIDRYRRWRVTDFGIANIAGVDVAGTTGTPAFAAPEQLLGEEQGPQADCFSLAAIAFFALSGNLPFGSGDARSILAMQLGQRADTSAFPDEIAAWMDRAFHPEPDRRFADASEMQAEWRASVDSILEAEGRPMLWRRWIP